MPQFRNQHWAKRFDVMGDTAEAKFEEVSRTSFVRFGLQRPPLKVPALPVRIRYAPDYLRTYDFVEVQGFGREQRLRVKVEKLNALHFWNGVHPVQFFAFDSKNDRWAFIPLKDIDRWIDGGTVELGHFPEGKAYFAIPASVIFGEGA